jgi:hypothetical protein
MMVEINAKDCPSPTLGKALISSGNRKDAEETPGSDILFIHSLNKLSLCPVLITLRCPPL